MSSPRRSPSRRFLAAWGALALSAGLTVSPLLGATPASAADTTSATGTAGQTLTVSKVTDVTPEGENITVKGSGYPLLKGVYIAVCKTPAKGERPTPCGGGADTSGTSQTSAWVASNPPSYAKSLTTPYGAGGTFDVTIFAAATLPDGTDCREVGCSVVTRTDHTRTSDRSQDVLVPITFAAADEGGDGAPVLIIAIVAAFAVLLVAVGVALVRRKRTLHEPDPADDAEAAVEATEGGTPPTGTTP